MKRDLTKFMEFDLHDEGQIHALIRSIYDKLKSKYGIENDLYIADTIDEIEIRYRSIWKNTESADELIEAIYKFADCELPDGALIYTYTMGITKDGKVVSAIICRKYDILKFFFNYYNLPKDLVVSFLYNSILHEIGHILSNNKLFNTYEREEASKIFIDTNANSRRLWDEYTNSIFVGDIKDICDLSNEDIRSYYIYYFNLPEEKSANDMVGLTAEELADEQIALYNAQDQ